MIQIINNWFVNLVDAYMHFKYGDRKTVLFENHPQEIIEIGAGYGANFRYLEKGTTVKVIEPNSDFFEILKYRAERYGINIEVYETGAEEMPFDENSSEMVICSLVLCSVEIPVKAVTEIKRVLEPGGRFAFIEHVKAQEHSWICKIQQGIKSPWKGFFDGCHVTRDTGKIIEEAGFSSLELEEFNHKTIFIPIIPHISGTATK